MSKLLNFIIESIEYDRLIEEGKDPVEVLHYKFQNIPSEIIDDVIAIDPTKKKSYSQWLLSKWDDEKDTIINGLKSGRIAKLFQHYKEHNDIQIKDCPSVEEGLRMFVPEEDTVLTKSNKPKTYIENLGREVDSSLANDFDIVYDDGDWIIAVPNTYEAECKLGENMRWCTANHFGNGESYYNNYLSKGGKYYVNFDMTKPENAKGKDYPFTRYQFHFESNQFMDKDDDPIELDSIGMPDGAKEYYSDEGYDTDQFENQEARMERYDEQRWGCSWRINDDLLLNIAYDDDYQFQEPDENTDYYVYDENDDRDPICWDEVANPSAVGEENVILVNEPEIVILKKKYGEDNAVVALTRNSSGRGWRDWEATTLNQYITLPNNLGVFGVDGEGHFAVVSPEISETCERIKVDSCENMFVNEQCTNVYDAEGEENIFVETVSNGYHSLFDICINPAMGDELTCVVYKDIPVNGEYFTINEQGLIEGEFRNYRVYDDGMDSSTQYDLEDKLPTGDYLICRKSSDRSKIEYNIMKKGSNQPLIDTWFDRYVGSSQNLYGVEATIKTDKMVNSKQVHSKKIGFFKIADGQQVGRWYDTYSGIDKEKDILGGHIGRNSESSDEVDIIDGNKGAVTATFGGVLSRKAINNKIIVLGSEKVGNNFTSKVFDYVEGRFYFPELNYFLRIDQYEHPYLFLCGIGDTEEKALFDLSSLNILSRGIKSVHQFNRYNKNFLRLNKLNGKCNAFDVNKQVEMLQSDVDDITGMNVYTHILIYVVNGKCYPLNYETGNIMINPNGIGVPTFVNDSDKIYCSSENYNIYFVPDNGLDSYKFYSWQSKKSYSDYGTNFDPQHTPQEVLNMYNLIFGQQESITRNFKDYVKRINEAMKCRYNDLID